ncbi:MAG: response regulator, partial [Caldilineaceae bacterium]|nr:response regulator [Caldilineaceae bacterium]
PARQPYIIAMTADAVDDYRTRCLAAGMNDFVTKPVRIDVLVAALQRALATLHGDSLPSKAAQ